MKDGLISAQCFPLHPEVSCLPTIHLPGCVSTLTSLSPPVSLCMLRYDSRCHDPSPFLAVLQVKPRPHVCQASALALSSTPGSEYYHKINDGKIYVGRVNLYFCAPGSSEVPGTWRFLVLDNVGE